MRHYATLIDFLFGNRGLKVHGYPHFDRYAVEGATGWANA